MVGEHNPEHPQLSSLLSLSLSPPSLLYMHFCAQVNKSITELNLRGNNLDAGAERALGQALEVSPIVIVISLSP